jgi:hypothetical protein
LPLYVKIQNTFLKGRPAELTECIQNARTVVELTADNNLGLAKMLCDAQLRFRLKNLTNTYLTLSVQDIASQLQLPDAIAAQKALVNLIGSGDIRARVDESTGMVSFADDADDHDHDKASVSVFTGGSALADKQREMSLISSIRATLDLQAQLEQLRCKMYASPAYIQHITAPSSRGAAAGSGGSGGIELADYELDPA